MKFNTPTVLAALALSGLGGFFAGRAGSPGHSSASPDAPSETRASRDSARNSTDETAATSRKISRNAKSTHGGTTTPKDRLASLEAIVRSENPLERNRALLAFLDQLGPGDFEEAVAHFDSLDMTDSRKSEYDLLLTAWAQADPVSALTYSKENSDGDGAQDTILATWASTDPEAAIRWAQSNHDGDGANPYLPGIIRGLAQSDPARATELLTSMPRSEERGKALNFILPHLLQMGAEATHTWISKITDESLRNGAIDRAAERLAEIDPAGTASWLLTIPGDAARRPMDDVYGAWASKDSEAALNSLGTLPPDIRTDALRGVIRRIAVDDPQAAVSLMDRYPNEVNDRVVQNFVWHSLQTDPGTAIGQIARIADEGNRNHMYQRALGHWMQQDPAAAQSWIQANPIPESVRNYLANPQNRTGGHKRPTR